jgi:hypothetical protein
MLTNCTIGLIKASGSTLLQAGRYPDSAPSQYQKEGKPLERITVEASVVCPTHQQIIGYMEARHWHRVARRERNEGPTYSRWQKDDQHYFLDIHESPEFPNYYSGQKDAVVLLADYDHWLDVYSLVQQLLRGGCIRQDSEVGQLDKTKAYFADTGERHASPPLKSGDAWQALDHTPEQLKKRGEQ